jgi:hypothetical protein
MEVCPHEMRQTCWEIADVHEIGSLLARPRT